MRRLPWLLIGLQAALVAGLAVALRSGRLPLGVPGEWEWSRLRVDADPADLALAMLGVAAYAGFAALGWRSLARRAGARREAPWLIALVGAAVAVQVAVMAGAPAGYGLTKWVTLGLPGSSGYYTVARRQMADPWRFWTEYPRWIREQDALHIGTHPPGLFLAARAALGIMESNPDAARQVVRYAPASVDAGFRQVLGPLPPADRAALTLTGAATLLACATTVLPIYFLARGSGLAPSAAWASAAVWPVLPSAVLFQPTADTAFPLLSATALALAARGRVGSAVVAGLVLGVGMMFTLGFLPVGLVAALVLVAVGPKERLSPSPRRGEGRGEGADPTAAIRGAERLRERDAPGARVATPHPNPPPGGGRGPEGPPEQRSGPGLTPSPLGEGRGEGGAQRPGAGALDPLPSPPPRGRGPATPSPLREEGRGEGWPPLARSASRPFTQRLVLLAAVGIGFLAVTLATWAVSGANPFVIWWWNQKHHARFYLEYPRSYRAWVVADVIELAVALGLPTTVWLAVGLRRAPPVAGMTLAVLALLALSGRSLSEVARLWLPLMPPLLLAAGAGLSRCGGRALALAATAALVGLQTLIVQATIQVVYPA